MPARPANPLLNLLSRVTDSVLLHVIEVQQAQLKMYQTQQPRFRVTKYSAAEKADPLSGGLQSLLFRFRQHFVERVACPIERLGVMVPLRDEL